MADLSTATKVGQRLRDRASKRGFAGTLALGAGVGLTGAAAGSGPVGMIAFGGLAFFANAVGLGLLSSEKSLKSKARVMETLVRGQTQMGALYGRKPAGASPSLGLMRDAAARTSSDLARQQTIGGAGRSTANSSGPPGGDGQTEAYTRLQNGRSVFVKGYATPSR